MSLRVLHGIAAVVAGIIFVYCLGHWLYASWVLHPDFTDRQLLMLYWREYISMIVSYILACIFGAMAFFEDRK